jgi:diguanylate cyclase (GGDEF)-like protein
VDTPLTAGIAPPGRRLQFWVVSTDGFFVGDVDGDSTECALSFEQVRSALATSRTLLAAFYRLSGTVSTGEAADELAGTACALTGAERAHVYVPDELGGLVWANANAATTVAPRWTVTIDVAREGPDLIRCLDTGQAVFVADAFAEGAPRRALRVRFGMDSLWFIPLADVGVLVLGWRQPRAAPPEFHADLSGFVTLCAQVLRRRITTTTLRDLTRTDPLTRLDNRRALRETLDALPARSGLLMIDLDHFKTVNDTFGHHHGDTVLQAFAQLLRDQLPHALSVARYGGEEFAVVLAEDGRNAGEQAFTDLQKAWHAHGWTFSAGLAVHRDGAAGAETLEAADRAMYTAKRSGRDRLVHAAEVAWTAAPTRAPTTAPQPIPDDAPLSLDELDEALRRRLVTPHYQPIIDTATGRVAGVEALARITHPRTGTLLLPADFLPLAERTGRVRELDRHVAGAAITQVARWRTHPQTSELTLAVNVSVDHLDTSDLPDFLTNRCRTAGLPTEALTVEITETLQSVTGRGHEDVVQHLREAGLQVALDDFGTGFSALSYLLRFPVTTIKIDMAFTAALGSDRGRDLVDGILATALRMRLSVVAEGVETTQQRDWLTTQGCPFVQGFLFSRPLPGQDLPTMITHLHAQPLNGLG